VTSDDTIDPLLLEAYVRGTGSPTERIQVDKWLAHNPARRTIVRGYRRLEAARIAAQTHEPHWETDRVAQGVLRGITHVGKPETSARLTLGRADAWPLASHTKQWRTGQAWRMLGALGLSVAFLVAGVSLWRATSSKRATSHDARVYHTGAEHRATIELKDGSHITLAPNSDLAVATRDDGTRSVTLIGQAYFDITSSTVTPLVVHAGPADVQVLGTSFSVRHYAGDASVVVAVTSGKVVARAVHTRDHRRAVVTLSQGMVASIVDSSVTPSRVPDIDSYVQWARGELTLRQVPIREALKTIGHWYGLHFEIADSTLSADSLTLTLNQKSRAEALDILTQVLNVRMTFDQTNSKEPIVTLHRRGAAVVPKVRQQHIQRQPAEVGK